MDDETLKRALVRYFMSQENAGPQRNENPGLQEQIIDALEVRGWHFETEYWEYFVGKTGEIQCALPLGVGR